jgi:hypothetical protein
MRVDPRLEVYHVRMSTQNYATHRRTDPLFHRTLLPVLFLTFVGSIVNLVSSWDDHERLYSASLIVVLSMCAMITSLYARIYALKAQDRAIRVEENFRHFVLTGKPFDARIGTRQAVALRFASDAEMPALAARAAAESLKPDDIKKAVKDWRADEYRV